MTQTESTLTKPPNCPTNPDHLLETLVLPPELIVLKSETGADSTILEHTGTVFAHVLINGCDSGSALVGFTFLGSTVYPNDIVETEGTIPWFEISENRFLATGAYNAIDGDGGGTFSVKHNLFVDISHNPVVTVDPNCEFINNTVVACGRGLAVYGENSLIINNIVVDCDEYGIWEPHATSTLAYNDMWNNETNNLPGTNGISQDPLFADPVVGDYTLSPWSPCIDAGDPDPQYNDPDGSRNDMGASPTTRESVIKVPEDFLTIQAAINVAEDGDTVLVAPGAYAENISFLGKNVMVLSTGGPDSTTIVAANTNRPVVSFSNGEPKGATLDGFAVTDSDSGGVFCVASSPTIRNCIIFNNYIWGDGGNPSDGAGICLYQTSGSCVCYNEIYGNQSTYGAGVHVRGSQNDTICYNVFHSNNGVGDIRAVDSVIGLQVYNNTFDVAVWSAVTNQSTGLIFAHNNIVCNSPHFAFQSERYAGGIDADYNCTFNNEQDYNFTPGDSCIFEDALFVDATNHDYALSSNSPCIDAGNPDYFFTDPDQTRGDIGAKYFHQNRPPGAFLLLLPQDTSNPPVLSLTPSFVWTQSIDPDPLDSVLYTLQIAIDSNFSFVSEFDSIEETPVTYPGSLSWGTRYWWKVKAKDTHGGETWSDNILSFRTVTLGDANGDGITNITDAVFLISYIFSGGAAPEPLWAGDANCDGITNITDAVYLIQYIFSGGPPPCDP